MNRNVSTLLALVGVLVVALLIWAVKKPDAGNTNGVPTTLPPVTNTSTPSTTSTPPATTSTPPAPTAPDGNITVTQPKANDTITSPLTIKGQARVFENTLSYELVDEDGLVLASGFTTALSPDVGQFGPYSATFTYPKPATETGFLRVFNYSARDGSRENTITVPVRFGQQTFPGGDQTTTVNVYFSNSKKDPNSTFCERTYPVMRTVTSTPRIGRAAIEALLKGPTGAELTQGYRTNIPKGVTLKDLVIENRVAKADFNDTLDKNVGGSCRVSAIRSQITNTLLQFPTIDKVEITINGKSEDVLQP